MTTLEQAARQAVSAWYQPHGINYVDFKPYMNELREALSQPEPHTDHPLRHYDRTCPACNAEHREPVAEIVMNRSSHCLQPRWLNGYTATIGDKLYLHPAREWQSLTDEDIAEIRVNGAHWLQDWVARAIESKLKAKNT